MTLRTPRDIARHLPRFSEISFRLPPLRMDYRGFLKEVKEMRGNSLSRIWYFIITVCLLFLSTAYALTMRGTLRAGPGIEDVGINKQGEKPSFVSNALLVKLTQPTAANLKVIGEDVNPAATGLSSLDSIFREHGVKSFRSIMTAN